MSLINIALTNNTIKPFIVDYENDSLEKIIDTKTILCDLSETALTDNSFNLELSLTNNDNSVQKFNVLFINNSTINNPIINNLKINNLTTNILFNNEETNAINTTLINQEFILTYSTSFYTAISTLKRYK